MSIRDLTISDLDSIAELDRLCFPPPIAFSRHMFEECLTSDYCQCFGLKKDHKLVAFAVIAFSGIDSIQIITVDVHPAHRRAGIADSLMAEIEARARAEEVHRISLQVSVDNEIAILLYEKWGFEVKARINDYYGRGKNAYHMDRSLAPDINPH